MSQDKPDSRSELKIRETNTVKRGGTVYLRLPPRVSKLLQAEHMTDMEMKIEESQYGVYMSAWNPDEQDYENNNNQTRVQE